MAKTLAVRNEITNAFCVDLEEWFHICGVSTPYEDPATWDAAPAHVVKDTEVIMRLLDQAGVKGTFLAVGWIGEKYPELIKRLSDAGHEIGCHSYLHRLVYTLDPAEFTRDLSRCLQLLREISRQPVTVFRAPGFSIKRECFWAYPILRDHGIEIDVSVVPAVRDHGGIDDFPRDPFMLRTASGEIKVFPVSVWSVGGKTVPFSGGGYLRLFPMPLIKRGFVQNLREGRPCMTYIHPREVNVDQPRLQLPLKKYVKYYIGINSVVGKLQALLKTYRFGTVSQTVAPLENLPVYELVQDKISLL
jgi:polysaccharide deacetylase family protein (PEP-CTERM system associated)